MSANNINPFSLPNVSLSKDTKAQVERMAKVDGKEFGVIAHPMLAPVISELAQLKPNWQFVCESTMRFHTPDQPMVAATRFRVYENQEYLGCIERAYERKDYNILITNDRIRADRQRGSGYVTSNPKRAVLKAKQTFGRKSTAERLNEALTKAKEYAGQALMGERSNHIRHSSTIQASATSYIMSVGFNAFLAYVDNGMPAAERMKVKTALEERERLDASMSTIADIRTAIGTTKSALVVRDGGKYIVRIGDKVELHDDNTLPDYMRGSLGMLKLVEKEHFIAGAGCRVDDEVFVVMLPEEVANKVSDETKQGEQG
jgi:hypothetical protein